MVFVGSGRTPVRVIRRVVIPALVSEPLVRLTAYGAARLGVVIFVVVQEAHVGVAVVVAAVRVEGGGLLRIFGGILR